MKRLEPEGTKALSTYKTYTQAVCFIYAFLCSSLTG